MNKIYKKIQKGIPVEKLNLKATRKLPAKLVEAAWVDLNRNHDQLIMDSFKASGAHSLP